MYAAGLTVSGIFLWAASSFFYCPLIGKWVAQSPVTAFRKSECLKDELRFDSFGNVVCFSWRNFLEISSLKWQLWMFWYLFEKPFSGFPSCSRSPLLTSWKLCLPSETPRKDEHFNRKIFCCSVSFIAVFCAVLCGFWASIVRQRMTFKALFMKFVRVLDRWDMSD